MSKQLVPGDVAPTIKSQAVQRGEIVDLTLEDALKGAEYLMLVFYPADFTFVCPTEIIQFMDKHTEFEKHRCNLVCCSTDSVYTHLAWLKSPKSERGLGGSSSSPIVLLSDRSHEISSAYGVLATNGAAYRGTFLIDHNKTICQVTINDMPVGRSVDDALRMLSELGSPADSVAKAQVNSSNDQPTVCKQRPRKQPRQPQKRQSQATNLPPILPDLTSCVTISGSDNNREAGRHQQMCKQHAALPELKDQLPTIPETPSCADGHPASALNFPMPPAEKQRRGLAERAAELETLAAQLRLRDSEERLSRVLAQAERLRIETEKQRADTERLKAEAKLKHREWDRLLRGDDAAVVGGGDTSEVSDSFASGAGSSSRKSELRSPWNA